ncbi:type II secretion system protein [Oceanobacillus picturae]|uniref:type II secretion system protein n=1 Tax=Oceanobacillus picturae TaxID=171693 RepID=UPI001603E2D2|nr:prepilin-type N-terminal cleavage/methylation domain-containing protein [Oceanobacillus picturae]
MRDNKGFTLIEVLITVSILLGVVITVIPLLQLLILEGETLTDRRYMNQELFDELQPFLWSSGRPLPQSQHTTFQSNGMKAVYHFTQERELIKGCVEWTNVKEKRETICLYGVPRKK